VTAPAEAPGSTRARSHGPHGGPGRRRHRLFWRIYLHGLVLLAAVALAAGAVGYAVNRGPPGREVGRFATYAATRVAELRGAPERLDGELARVREAFGLLATVRDGRGAVIASSAAPPLPAPDDPARLEEGPVRLRGHGWGWAAALPGGGTVVVRGGFPAGAAWRAVLSLAAVLFALALASIPLVRAIARPVERLTVAARRLGEGDLSVRAHLRAPGEVGDLARAFDEMAARLEAQVRAEKELLANVSHELRTPLARIRVAVELAAEGDLERARRHLAGIGADLDELEHLVEDVLAAARLDLAAGNGTGLPAARDEVDVGALARAAADRFRAAWPERALAVEVAERLPPVRGDAALLRRLLANLLDNARKYSEPPAPVTLGARAADGAVLLEVRDRGIGIAPEDLPHLFTPFFRTDRSRARGTGGVGLGLALARRIARAHGGEIEAESAPGEGTTFRVRLPAGP
jgi:signal transduction histidine kinase